MRCPRIDCPTKGLANVIIWFAEKPNILLRDYDGKFSPEFDAILEATNLGVQKVGP